MGSIYKEFLSGQSTVRKEGTTIVKSFFNPADYEQEKYFLSLLSRHNLSFVPKIIKVDDTLHEITMPFYGISLDNVRWENKKESWFCQTCELMESIWVLKANVKDKYVRPGKSGLTYVGDFLEVAYKKEMASIGVNPKTISRAVKWKNGILDRLEKESNLSAIIHFDLSPRNVVLDNASIHIIDWSRAMFSELSIELAIVREKFMVIGKTWDCLPDFAKKTLNISLVDLLALCFSLYRKAKKVKREDQKNEYLELVESTLSQK